MADPQYEDGEVLGVDADGSLVCWNADVGEPYNCGETLEQFGASNLREHEVERVEPGKPFTLAPFQVWQLRSSEDGGNRMLSAVCDKEAQEAEMTFWVGQLPDALLVYRTYKPGRPGVYEQELHLDRTLAKLPKGRP